jgi:hypothetical protein
MSETMAHRISLKIIAIQAGLAQNNPKNHSKLVRNMGG